MKTPTYQEILPYIERKLVSEQAHPDDPAVRIFNYTQTCQFAQAWDDTTRQCRGLIMNVETGEVLARPFPKFFNYGEHVSKGWAIPTTRPIVSEKLDGSLGILYSLNGRPWIATRGSFTSNQAVWATEWWRANVVVMPNPGETGLFEIIYPENRIVVAYDFSGMVHLATLRTDTGKQLPRDYAIYPGVRKAKEVEYTDMETLEKMDEPNSEGFVLYYPEENVRMKVKFPEYVRLHRIVTGINEIAIWEHLKDEKPMDALVQSVPDEFFNWVTEVSNRLGDAFEKIYTAAREDYDEILTDLKIGDTGLGEPIAPETRKEFAIAAGRRKNPGILFAMLDNKPVAPIIWKMVRPHGARVFKTDIDL